MRFPNRNKSDAGGSHPVFAIELPDQCYPVAAVLQALQQSPAWGSGDR